MSELIGGFFVEKALANGRNSHTTQGEPHCRVHSEVSTEDPINDLIGFRAFAYQSTRHQNPCLLIIRSSRSFVTNSCLITNRQGYTTCTVGPCQEGEQQTVRNRHRRLQLGAAQQKNHGLLLHTY